MTQNRWLTNLPNALTLARCGFALFVGWLIHSSAAGSFWPFILFVLVAATDFLDGYAARKLDVVSELGAFLDPLADKLLVGASLIALSSRNELTLSLLVPTIAIVVRDLIATGLRLVPSIDMPVSKLAKWKTSIEMVGIGGLLLAMGAGLAWLWSVSLVALWLAAVLAVYTLGLYVGALIAESKRPHS